MDELDLLDSLAMASVCPTTRNAWLWYCDEHDTHGNADSEEEAECLATAHRDFYSDLQVAEALDHQAGNHDGDCGWGSKMGCYAMVDEFFEPEYCDTIVWQRVPTMDDGD